MNIAELEEHISTAYTASQLLKQELTAVSPEKKRIMELSEVLSGELEKAEKFEICVEQRKVI